MLYTNDAIFQMFTFWFPLIILAIIWSLIWKGAGLWKAARQGDTGWFIVFLVINTLGILEILYIYFFSNKEEKNRLASKMPEKTDEKKV